MHNDRADGGLLSGVEQVCTVLSEQGCPIAPSTHHDAGTAVLGTLAVGRAAEDRDHGVQAARSARLSGTELDKIANAPYLGPPCRPGLTSGSGQGAEPAPVDHERAAREYRQGHQPV